MVSIHWEGIIGCKSNFNPLENIILNLILGQKISWPSTEENFIDLAV